MKLRRKDFLIRTAMIAAGAALAVALTPVSQTHSWSVYDWLQRKFPAPAFEGAALIELDQESLNAFDKEEIRFPLPREIYGAVAEVAAAAGARAIAFDIIFSEASSNGSADPSKGPAEPLSCANPRYVETDDCRFSALLKKTKLPVILPSASPLGQIKEPYVLVGEGATHLGGAHAKSEDDGVYRRSPDRMPSANGTTVPSFAQVLLEAGFPDRSTHTNPNSELLHFPKREMIPRISLYNVIKAHQDHIQGGRPLSDEFAKLRDKVWIVAYSAGGLLDLKPIPTDPLAPGAVIHAVGLSNRLTKDFITDLGPWEVGILCLSLNIIMMILTGAFNMPSTALTFAVTGVLGAAAFTSIGLWQKSIWLSPGPVLASCLLVATANLSRRFQSEWKERMKLARNLAHTMSEEMVALIRAGEVEVSRYGEKREITILFSDLEGFTSISEHLDPAQLVEFMNAYFEEVVHLIFAHKGYVDKFIGDAVMALWGAPLDSPRHAMDGLKAAMSYEAAVQRFNDKMLAQFPGLPHFASRVGLHTGFAVAGNIGSSQRYNYTAFGDSVNLASRLEGMGKKYEVYLLISEDTVTKAKAENMPGLLEIDTVSVKGRQAPTKIYTSVDPELAPEIEMYKNALAEYRDGRWQAALDLFKKAPHLGPSSVMIGRCQDAIKNGPSNHWRNGVWVHDSK